MANACKSLWVEGRCVLPAVRFAWRAPERLRGLLGGTALPPGQGLCIPRCSAVHTFGMGFDLDLLFLDRHDRILRFERRVRPWRVAWGGFQARGVVELASGWLDPAFVPLGGQVEWRTPEG